MSKIDKTIVRNKKLCHKKEKETIIIRLIIFPQSLQRWAMSSSSYRSRKRCTWCYDGQDGQCGSADGSPKVGVVL